MHAYFTLLEIHESRVHSEHVIRTRHARAFVNEVWRCTALALLASGNRERVDRMPERK